MASLFPNLNLVGSVLPTAGTSTAGGLYPMMPFTMTAGVLDDAKSKAKSLESEAKDALDGAAGSAKSEAEQLRSRASAASPAGKGKIELYSGKYYAACALGGILACGITHAFVTPLDLVKCRRQVRPCSPHAQRWCSRPSPSAAGR